jgi:uncharacterized repeat protein (TIGR01451 family)
MSSAMSKECAEGPKLSAMGNLKALLLSLILGALATVLLLSILDAAAHVSASREENVLNSSGHRTSISTAAPTTPTVHITKTVVPTNPDTGGVVTICFTVDRTKLDVVLVQDVSGSMNDPAGEGVTGTTRLTASQKAAITFVLRLRDTDRAAVVAYNKDADLVQQLTTNKSSITDTIAGLKAEGCTNMVDGIKVSHSELVTSERSDLETIKALILLSDGYPTCPEDPDAVKREARKSADDGIKIYTIGFGVPSDEGQELLQDIANIGSGKYFYAPDGSALETTYLTIAWELQNLVITDILPSGVIASCPQEPPGCNEISETNAITWSLANSLLMSNPLTFCFTAVVNLDPPYTGTINLPGSRSSYQDPSGQISDTFNNPTVTVSGRKITGYVFWDPYCDGDLDDVKRGEEGVVVSTSTGLTTATNADGSYVLRISNEPALSVTIVNPPGRITTPTIPHSIPTTTGIYTADFGICRVVYLPMIAKNYASPSLSCSEKAVNKPVAYAGDVLRYTVTLSNCGTMEAISGVVTDEIPLHTSFITVTGADPPQNRQIHWSGRLGPKTSLTGTHVIEFEVSIDNSVNDSACTITNAATIKETNTGRRAPIVISTTTQVAGIGNGGFENGWACWMHGGNTGLVPDYPRSGNYSARLGHPDYECDGGVPIGVIGWIEQTTFVPSMASPKLSFWYRIFTHDKNPELSDDYDSFDVKINGMRKFRDMNQTDPFRCGNCRDLGWKQATIDLSSYRDSYITIRFENWNRFDNLYNTWTYVDDVRIVP